MLRSASMGLALVLCSVFIASVRAQCGAGLSYCTPGINQCYLPINYECIQQPSGGTYFLCPKSHCLCGQIACYLPSQYGCKDGGLTQNTADNKDGHCPGGSGGDPLIRGFDSCRWYMEGTEGKTYNLVAGEHDTVNTRLVAANLTDASHAGNGTYHGSLSFRHRDHFVEAEVSAEGNLTVTVDGKRQPFDSRFHVGDMKGKVVEHMTYFGQYLEVTTPSFTYAVQAVQPAATEAGLQRGHADLDITLHSVPDSGLHGLLGQSYKNIQAPQCREDYAFPGEGTEEDYEVPSLSSLPSVQASPVVQTTRRSMIEEDSESRLPVTASTAAYY